MNTRPFALLASMALLACACGQPSDNATKKTKAAPAAPAPVEKEVDTTPATAAKPSLISAHSKAYYGDLKRNPVDGPVEIKARPNTSVVILVFDALNAQHLSAYGYERPTSPRIDALAKEGLLLTNYHSNSSWTRPSFTTIVTGLSKKDHGVELRGGYRLEPHITTLAERFRKAGYRTAGYTGNPLVRKSWGFDQGYQTYRGPTTEGMGAFPRDSIWMNMAVDWLQGLKDKPFFLVMFLTSPHPPYRPPMEPRRFLKTVPEGKIIEHPWKEYNEPLPKDDHDRIVAAYDDEIAYMDVQIGRLVDTLKELGRMDDTIIVMTSDHGEMMGQHNSYLHAYHMWQQTLRVPFMMRAPNLPLTNAVDDRPFTHMDIAPTVLDMVGIPYDETVLKGESMVKVLADPDANRERILFSQYNAHGVQRQAFMNGPWKLIHHHQVEKRAEEQLDSLHPNVDQASPRELPSLAWDGERFEMYRIDDDPGELKNVLGSKEAAEQEEILRGALKTYLGGTEEETGDIPPEVLEALKNAGYIR